MTPKSNQFDVIILGAGAAGLMCAIEAAKRGRRTLVLEHSNVAGKKILISGGGRCNFTNLHTRPENYIGSNPHFVKSALARYTPSDFILLVEKHRIPYHEKKLGQLFCDRSARDITGMLLAECAGAGAAIELNCRITDVRRTTYFVVETSMGQFSAPALVVATGGLSIPKMGATSLGYDLAKKFKVQIAPTRPALVPLTFGEPERTYYSGLAGVSADVSVTCNGASFDEKMLFTHRGVSGPAILQISSYWRPHVPLVINLLPSIDISDWLQQRPSSSERPSIKSTLSEWLPKRLADVWVRVNTTQSGSLDLRCIHHWQVSPSGTEGYDKAEVTAGGVHPDELSSKTMESRRVPGLFFIGEVVDVTGHLGGYNFQWAWASGFAAGQSV